MYFPCSIFHLFTKIRKRAEEAADIAAKQSRESVKKDKKRKQKKEKKKKKKESSSDSSSSSGSSGPPIKRSLANQSNDTQHAEAIVTKHVSDREIRSTLLLIAARVPGQTLHDASSMCEPWCGNQCIHL